MAGNQRSKSRPRPRRATVRVVRGASSRRDDTVRWSKVIAARARIVAGHYDRDDVKSRLIESVLRALDPPTH